MRIFSTFVFALAILFSCIAMATPSFAKMLECERYDTIDEHRFQAGAFDSWYPKTLQIPTREFKSIKGRTALAFERSMNEVNSGHRSKMIYTLLTSKKLIMRSPSIPGGAKYNCDMTPEEVLAAQTSPSTPSTAANGCFGGNVAVCDDDFICQKATSTRSGSREWETTRTWESYVKEAKSRDLSCGVSEVSNQSTTQSSTSSTTSTPSKADKSKAFCKDIGFTAGTEKFGECVLKMMDK